MKGSGGVASERVRTPAARGGDQFAGAAQFVMSSPPKAKPARMNEIEPRNEALRVSTEHLLLNVETERRPAKVGKQKIDDPASEA
jgi:hypothetical protein